MNTRVSFFNATGLALALVLLPVATTRQSAVHAAVATTSGSPSQTVTVVNYEANIPLEAGACQCTTYVYNYEAGSLQSNYPNAYQWGPWLLGQNWYNDSGWNANDIAVFQPGATLYNSSYKGWNITMDPTYGHVGILTTASTNLGNHQWRITLQSANINAGEPQFTNSNCTNVSLLSGTVYDTQVAAYTAGGHVPVGQ